MSDDPPARHVGGGLKAAKFLAVPRMTPRPPTKPLIFGLIGSFLLDAGAVTASGFGTIPDETGLGPQAKLLLLGLGFLSALLLAVGSIVVQVARGRHALGGGLMIVAGLFGLGPWNFVGFALGGCVLALIGGAYALGLEYPPRPALPGRAWRRLMDTGILGILAAILLVLAAFVAPWPAPWRYPNPPPTYLIDVWVDREYAYDVTIPAIADPNGSSVRIVRVDIEGDGTLGYAVVNASPAFRVRGSGNVSIAVTYAFAAPPYAAERSRFPAGAPDLDLWVTPPNGIGSLGNVSVSSAGVPPGARFLLTFHLQYQYCGTVHRGAVTGASGRDEVLVIAFPQFCEG